ncbi:hypothetical protein R3P38DRAFT_3176281 [Favolaschia claudopus]|uniref:Uncharacterized protein n=1 Tax=Favolaschia claudopus TaxID=2862362 RepID=A0AAW0D7V5_9AGAR
MLQSILRPTGNATATTAAVSLPPYHSVSQVQRVAFCTDRVSKPISRLETRALKGEWTAVKRPHGHASQNMHHPYMLSSPSKSRLRSLSETANYSVERLSFQAKTKMDQGWERIVRRIDLSPRRPIPRRNISSPKRFGATPTAHQPIWLNRKPNLTRASPAKTPSYTSYLLRARATPEAE